MIQKVNAPVVVIFKSDPIKKIVMPVRIFWGERKYDVQKLTWHNPKYEGKTLYHYYSVLTETILFKLKLNTSSQLWILEEIADGEPN